MGIFNQLNSQCRLVADLYFLRIITDIGYLYNRTWSDFQCKLAIDISDNTVCSSFFNHIGANNRFAQVIRNDTCNRFLLLGNDRSGCFFCFVTRQDNIRALLGIIQSQLDREIIQNFLNGLTDHINGYPFIYIYTGIINEKVIRLFFNSIQIIFQ